MRIVTKWSTTLSASVTSSQTTLPVSSIKTLDDSAHTIAIGDFTDTFGYMTIEPGSSNIELIKFTGITDNGDGSGILTGVTRGLAFYGGTDTAVTANQHAHQAGWSIICSNTHYYYDRLVDKISSETIAGVKTFSDMPATTAGNPIADSDLARKAYVDSTVSGTTVSAGIIVNATAGATVANGNLVYLDKADGEWKLCDADNAATVENVQLGIAQGAGTDGVAITNGVMILGQDDAQSSMTAGQTMYASNTAGAIANTPGTVNKVVGIARSGSVLYFNPGITQQVISTRVSALAGTSGTPSASNKYVTADDVSATGGADKIIRASGTLIAPGILVPPDQLSRDQDSQGAILYRSTARWTQLVAGVSGQVLKTQGASANPTWTNANYLDSKSTSIASGVLFSGINTASEQTMYTIPVPAGAMGLNGAIKVTVQGNFGADASEILIVRYGGTAFYTSPAVGGNDYIAFVTIQNQNSASSQRGGGFMIRDGITSINPHCNNTGTVNSATAQNVTVVVTEGGRDRKSV